MNIADFDVVPEAATGAVAGTVPEHENDAEFDDSRTNPLSLSARIAAKANMYAVTAEAVAAATDIDPSILPSYADNNAKASVMKADDAEDAVESLIGNNHHNDSADIEIELDDTNKAAEAGAASEGYDDENNNSHGAGAAAAADPTNDDDDGGYYASLLSAPPITTYFHANAAADNTDVTPAAVAAVAAQDNADDGVNVNAGVVGPGGYVDDDDDYYNNANTQNVNAVNEDKINTNAAVTSGISALYNANVDDANGYDYLSIFPNQQQLNDTPTENNIDNNANVVAAGAAPVVAPDWKEGTSFSFDRYAAATPTNNTNNNNAPSERDQQQQQQQQQQLSDREQRDRLSAFEEEDIEDAIPSLDNNNGSNKVNDIAANFAAVAVPGTASAHVNNAVDITADNMFLDDTNSNNNVGGFNAAGTYTDTYTNSFLPTVTASTLPAAAPETAKKSAVGGPTNTGAVAKNDDVVEEDVDYEFDFE